MHTRTLSALVPFLLLLTGCAVGVTHQLETAVPTVRTTGTHNAFVVSSQDRRSYVVSGKKPESFVGLSRAGFGNPFDGNTASGSALANDIRKALASAIFSTGARVDVIAVTPQEGESAALEKLASYKTKAVVLTISEWTSDTCVYYDLTVSVVAADGKITARNRIWGADELGGSAFNPPEASRQAVPPALKGKLEQVLSALEIAAEL